MTAWYQSDCATFLGESVRTVVGQLAAAAARDSLYVESNQHEEWTSSVGLLQSQLAVKILRDTLKSPDLADFGHVILEYDFKRRGLRLDCILLGKGIVAVIEFKRSEITAADRDQVTGYCINLIEFHEETRRVCQDENCIVAPLLTLTLGNQWFNPKKEGEFYNPPWDSILRQPLQSDHATLHEALRSALKARRGTYDIDRVKWLKSRFSPSSTILDAAISLYGQHKVSAIREHAVPIKLISECTEEVAKFIAQSKQDGKNRIIFVSGAPGAGKTLVGLNLAFDVRFKDDAVFVTGNAPLVEVLSESLKKSYRSKRTSNGMASGFAKASAYHSDDQGQVRKMATFKIVKAHAFLGERGSNTKSSDGSIVIFDEAQRTYKKGTAVLGNRLEDDEAALILDSLKKSYDKGAVVVALLGHNQAINSPEMGAIAWFEAAKSRGWHVVISDETLKLSEVANSGHWGRAPNRETLTRGHLAHSLRYYRNAEIERWASCVLEEGPIEAREVAAKIALKGDTIWIVRDIAKARKWVRDIRVGDNRAGIIGSAQGRRLAAEGLFVQLKPDISSWMLYRLALYTATRFALRAWIH